VALSSAFTWGNGVSICITSTETNGGDSWYDTQVVTGSYTGVVHDFSVYENAGAPIDQTAGEVYIPVNFRIQ